MMEIPRYQLKLVQKIKPNKNDGLTMTGNAWNWEMLVRRVKFVEFPHGDVDIQPDMIGFC